jgi:hypothetical protein
MRPNEFPGQLDHLGHIAEADLVPPGVSGGGSEAGGSAGVFPQTAQGRLDRRGGCWAGSRARDDATLT